MGKRVSSNAGLSSNVHHKNDFAEIMDFFTCLEQLSERSSHAKKQIGSLVH